MRFRRSILIAALTAAASLASAQTATSVPVVQVPTTAKIFFRSTHAPCAIAGSTLAEGIYRVGVAVVYGGVPNTINTKGFAHYETASDGRYTHVYVDFNLDAAAACPELTFVKQ